MLKNDINSNSLSLSTLVYSLTPKSIHQHISCVNEHEALLNVFPTWY